MPQYDRNWDSIVPANTVLAFLSSQLNQLREIHDLVNVASATLAQQHGTHYHLQTMTETNVFKRHLKAFLFTESFS